MRKVEAMCMGVEKDGNGGSVDENGERGKCRQYG
jgi:hypothetical protein